MALTPPLSDFTWIGMICWRKLKGVLGERQATAIKRNLTRANAYIFCAPICINPITSLQIWPPLYHYHENWLYEFQTKRQKDRVPIVDKFEWERRSEVKQNGGELANHDGIFVIDKGITYKFDPPFITTTRTGCMSFKPEDKRIGCRSLTSMCGRGSQKSSKMKVSWQDAMAFLRLTREWLTNSIPPSSLPR